MTAPLPPGRSVERALTHCTSSGNCPGVRVLPDGRIAVTGSLPDGTEATVLLPAAVFDRAARAWCALPPQGAGPDRGGRRAVKRSLLGLAFAAPFAAFGLLVATLTQDATGSPRVGTLAGMAATAGPCWAWAAWRRRRSR